ncbi:hypothetical protein N0V88_004898 [Collariella sp. IMI 366227]|nr:hypothetical protein N0V88_004898 [Collariella sp. IMI 366227]
MSAKEFTVYKGSPNGQVFKSSTSKGPPQNQQVLIRITHSGVCGTDEHYKTQDMVLGHEGVGIVEAVGDQVASLKVGDRVGWGYCHGSCKHCSFCLTGKDLYCADRRLYGFTDLDQGSFASHAVWDEDFVYPVPESLSSEAAAPLMCAGASVYSAMQRASVRPSQRVGIIGMGGLGHLAIQFAAKMGCETVVFSHSTNKKDEASSFGTSEFYVVGRNADSAPPVDCLLVTSAQQPSWAEAIRWTKRGGTISVMTVDTVELNFKELPLLDLMLNAVEIQGSLPAPREMHREMLRFAAFHGIRPKVETFKLDEDGIAAAMQRLREGKVRYRAVLVA